MYRNLKKSIALVVAVIFACGTMLTPALADELSAPKALSMEQTTDLMRNNINGEEALNYVAYPYMGWRTSGGPWFNSVIDWIGGNLDSYGFAKGENTKGDSYWIQTDVPNDEKIWSPEYASLEIAGPEGDQNFDFKLNTFNPNNSNYPKDITYDWIKNNIGSTKEALLNERCHLARESGFTDPAGTTPNAAKGITAEVVYVGKVTLDEATNKYIWTENKTTSLKGKIIFGTNSRNNLYKLAIQEGSLVSICSQINNYNNPTIDGKELYPNTVQYAGIPNDNPANPVAFNLSPNDEKYLIKLLGDAKTPITMKAVAVGTLYPYSKENPMKTVVAEIKGAVKPEERIIMIAHVQEPGANDNATGVGLQMELVKTLKSLIDSGKLPRPARTLTFLWGDEYRSSYLWRDAHPDNMKDVKAALVLDMVGENPEKTGGSMRIEKSPDPSAVYSYGLDLLPGEVEPTMDKEFIRKPDTHTLWGAGELSFWPYPGTYLNDLYFKSSQFVQKESPNFKVGSNPYEGGSDHDPFLWYAKNFKEENNDNFKPQWSPIPALLSWHFTDYVYHTSMDTLDKVSASELKNVGITTANVALNIASGTEESAIESVKAVSAASVTRFGAEMKNSEKFLKWTYAKATKEKKSAKAKAKIMTAAVKKEKEILNAWAKWYKEAIKSASGINISAPSASYKAMEQKELKLIDAMNGKALKNVEKLGKKYIK